MKKRDIIDKINSLLSDQDGGATTTGDVAKNTAGVGGETTTSIARRVSSIGYKCPKGKVWDKEKRKCVSVKLEASVVGGSYQDNSTVNIVGSGQTRAVGSYGGEVETIKKNKLKFSTLLGIYTEDFEEEDGI